MNWIEIDGSQGEGGGQILRSSLSLSMITGKPVRFKNIRAKRAKPGLARQHLTAILASQAICDAKVEGAQLRSMNVSFIPGQIKAGDYFFDLGTAGSTALVLQTLLPALWYAKSDNEQSESRIKLHGGTHNPMAPSVSFLQQAWLPLVAKMGIESEITLKEYGFYPAGGGVVEAVIKPVSNWQAVDLSSRGELLSIKAQSVIASIPEHVANRELDVARKRFDLTPEQLEIIDLGKSYKNGNILALSLQFAHLNELIFQIGEKGKSAELVATEACNEAKAYLKSNAAVGEHLADQLLLPMALAGKGCFTTNKVTDHLTTNIAVIKRFLDVDFSISEKEGLFLVNVG